MEGKHTEGPWSASGATVYAPGDVVVAHVTAAYFAELLEGSAIGDDAYTYPDGGPEHGLKECYANARLIAAAPALLEALERMQASHAELLQMVNKALESGPLGWGRLATEAAEASDITASAALALARGEEMKP